ncbi:MAG: hypothetical protein H8E85_06675 [Candidatus Marinimicrobia bacterium]|nr:hypothetical protein [Candidatus Neomarinimicrobiota bacterium]
MITMDKNILHMLAVVIIYVFFIRKNIGNKYWGMRLGFLYAAGVIISTLLVRSV